MHTWMPAALEAGVRRLRNAGVTVTSAARWLLWTVIASAAAAFLWVLWTESVHRR